MLKMVFETILTLMSKPTIMNISSLQGIWKYYGGIKIIVE
jgi:hypothetical protein